MEYNPEEYKEILNIFKTESEEMIQGLNDGFLELEKNPENKEPLKRLMQLSHSLKGSARMLGFKSIQDIAHKIEDILIYWKDDNVKININFFQLIYDVCDFVQNLIQKTVEIGSDPYGNEVIETVNKLNNFLTYNRMVPVEEPHNKVQNEKEINNIDVNAILLELMFIMERETQEDEFQEIMSVAADNLTRLNEIYSHTNYSEIKNEISGILLLINSDEHPENDLEYYRKAITELRNKIYSVNKEISHNSVEIQNKKEENTENIKDSNNLTANIDVKFEKVLSILPKIRYEKKYIYELNELLIEISEQNENEKADNVINKTVNILELLIKKDINIDNDCYMVVLQCIYLARGIYKGDEEQCKNLSFLLQRLNLVEDMLNIDINDSKNEVIVEEKNTIVSNENYDNFNKNLTPFDLQEIKTLRVDISKLDNLISRTGELLINGIKNREHLVDLSLLNNNFVKWQIESKKIFNYIKYYEKKGFFSDNNEMANIFYKKILNFFNENFDIINDLNKDFTDLYKNISEDDNKLHQTALEIESIAKGIRVLPLAAIFHSFPRMVRDIAKENNKKIDIYISGSDTTVDKKIIEEIKMPLIHIIRNSISHGIETPQDRIKNNKKETGIIRLSAKQAENNVVIVIEDDGYGINLDKVKETALQKGILLEEEIKNLTDEQLMKLIFLPGFSTKESVTEISGRGVGLDVVKTKIAGLNGDITVDSVLNKGCRVTIKVPLSMSTLKTFIICVNDQKYAIPINAVKYVKQVNMGEIINKDNQKYIIFEDNPVPVYNLSEIFGYKSDEPLKQEDVTVIITELQSEHAAFIVDKLIGSQEIFQKKLSAPILKIRNISGITTLPSGEICLIINPYDLMRNTLHGLAVV